MNLPKLPNIAIKESTKKELKAYGLFGKAQVHKALGKLTGNPQSEQYVADAMNESDKMFREARESREKEQGIVSVFQKFSNDSKLCEQCYNRILFLDKKLESAHGEKNRRALIAERLYLKEKMINLGIPAELFFKDENYEAALEAYFQRRYITYRMYMNKRKQEIAAKLAEEVSKESKLLEERASDNSSDV